MLRHQLWQWHPGLPQLHFYLARMSSHQRGAHAQLVFRCLSSPCASHPPGAAGFHRSSATLWPRLHPVFNP